MSLQKRLDAIKADFEKKAPQAAVETMQRATEELRASDAAKQALDEGASAPSFTLPDTRGNTVSSGDLLAEGPLVVSFFRGKW